MVLFNRRLQRTSVRIKQQLVGIFLIILDFGATRQYIPKGHPLQNVSDKELVEIELRLNDLPRKRLGYKNPKYYIHIFTK